MVLLCNHPPGPGKDAKLTRTEPRITSIFAIKSFREMTSSQGNETTGDARVGRVHLCNQMYCVPASSVSLSLTFPVLLHIGPMAFPILPPVVPVVLSPSPLGIRPVPTVIRIIRQLRSLPPALSFPLTLEL